MNLFPTLYKLLPLAALAMSILLLAVLTFVSYRRQSLDNDTMTWSQSLSLTGLLLWLVAALLYALLNPFPSSDGSAMNLHLFSSYVSAWNQWSWSELQSILCSLLLFLPLGLLLPLAGKPFRNFKWVVPFALVCTLGLECLQLATGRGIFSLDDMVHNLLGCLMGYFIVMAGFSVWKKSPLALPIAKALLLPLCFALLFGGAAAVYHFQELGNLPILPSYHQSMSQVDLTLDTSLSNASGTAALYQNSNVHNLRQGEVLASLLAKELNLSPSSQVRQRGNKQCFSFTDLEGKEEYSLVLTLNSGNWTFLSLSGEHVSVSGDLDRIRWRWESWLTENHFLHKDAVYSLSDTGTLRWDLEGPESLATYRKDFTAGAISITLTRGGIPEEIQNFMCNYRYLRDIEVISPSAAYEQVKQGRFSLPSPLVPGDKLVFTDCRLSYCADTKGFYQPVYEFIGYLNRQDETVRITIPACG